LDSGCLFANQGGGVVEFQAWLGSNAR